MKRVALLVLSALSLLLLLATLSLWIRSHWYQDRLTFARTTRFTINSHRGVLSFSRQWFTDGPWQGPRHFHPLDPEPLTLRSASTENIAALRPPWTFTKWPDSHLGTSGQVLSSHGLTVTFPHYLPALLALIFPTLLAFNLYRRRRARARNLCPTCSYDLRATPDRCPECGTARSPR